MDDEDPDGFELDFLDIDEYPEVKIEPLDLEEHQEVQKTKTTNASTSTSADQEEASSSTSAEEPERVPSPLDIWLSDPKKLAALCKGLLNLDCNESIDLVETALSVLEIASKRLLPNMEDAAAVKWFLELLEIYSKFHQLQDEHPILFFTIATGILGCMVHLTDSQFNCLFSKEDCCDMILAALYNFLTNANMAQDNWPRDPALKANTMKILQRLFAVCKNGGNTLVHDRITRKMNMWLDCVFPFIFYVHAEVRIEAIPVVCTMREVIPQKTFFGLPCWSTIKDDFHILYSRGLSYLAQEDVAGWPEAWKYCLEVFDREITARPNNLLINKLLEIQECAFKSSHPRGRLAAFGCWKELIDRYLDTSSPDLIRWIRLLLRPMLSTNSKSGTVSHAKLDILWYILHKLQPEIEKVGDHVLPQFLTLCYAPGDELGYETECQKSPSTPMLRDENSMLVPLLDAITQLLNPDCEESTLSSYVLPSFPKPFIENPQFFVKHSRLLFKCVAECTVVVGKSVQEKSDDERLRLFYVANMWKNLMYQVEGAFKIENKTVQEKKSLASLMKNLLKFLQYLPRIELTEMCMTPILETVVLGDNSLPLAVLYSKLFAVNSNSPFEGTPLHYLVNLILSPELLENHGNKYRYMSVMDHLLKAGIGKLSMTAKFTEAVLRTLEMSVSSRKPDSKLPMAVEAWLAVYKYLKSVIAAGYYDHLAKDDASLKWLYPILLFPVKFMNIWEDYQVNMMLNAWTYIAFLFGRASVAYGKGDSFLCERFCHFIQTSRVFKWDKLTFEDLQFLVRMYAVAVHLAGEVDPSSRGAESPQLKLKYSVLTLKRILVTFQKVSTDSREFMDFSLRVMVCTKNVLRKIRGPCKEAYVWSFSPRIVPNIRFMINHLSAYAVENPGYVGGGVSLLQEYALHFGQIPFETLLPLFHSLLSNPCNEIKGLAVALWREKYTALLAKSRLKSRSLKVMLEECKKIVQQAPPRIYLPYRRKRISPKVKVQLIPQINVQPSALTQELNDVRPSCSSSAALYDNPLSVIEVTPMINQAAVVDVNALPQSSNEVSVTEPLPQLSNHSSSEEGNRKRAAGRPLTRHQKRKLKERRDDIPALYADLSQDTQWTCNSDESSQLVIPERFKPVQASPTKPVKDTPDHGAQSSRSETSTNNVELDLRAKEELVAHTLRDMINLANAENPANQESDNIHNLFDVSHKTLNTGNAISVDPETDSDVEGQVVCILNSLLNSACVASENLSSVNQDSSVLAANSENIAGTSSSERTDTSGYKASSVVPSQKDSIQNLDNTREKTPVEIGSGQRRKAFKPKKLDLELKNRARIFGNFEEPLSKVQDQLLKQAVDPIEESLHLLFDDKSEYDTCELVVASHVDVIDSREALRAILEDHAPELQCSTSTSSNSRVIFPKREACRKRKSGIKHKHRFKPRHKGDKRNASTPSVNSDLAVVPRADHLNSPQNKLIKDHSLGSQPNRVTGKKAQQTMHDVQVSQLSQNFSGDSARNDLQFRYELRSKEKNVPNEKSSAEEPNKNIHELTKHTTQKLNKELVSPSKAMEGNLSSEACLSTKSTSDSSIEQCSLEGENASTNVPSNPCSMYTASVEVVSKNLDLSNAYPTESEHPSVVQHNKSADSGINISDEFELEQRASPGPNHTASGMSEVVGSESTAEKRELGSLPEGSTATKSKKNRKRSLDKHSSVKDSISSKKPKTRVDLKRDADTREEMSCSPVSKRLRSSFKHSDLCLSNISKDSNSNTLEQNGKSSRKSKSKTSKKNRPGDRTGQQPMLKYIIPLYRHVSSANSQISNQEKQHEGCSSLHPQLEQSESSGAQGLSGNCSRSDQSYSEDTVALLQEHSPEKIELLRQLSLVPQVLSSHALNTLSAEQETLEVIAPNDEACVENHSPNVQEHDVHIENTLSDGEIDQVSQNLNLSMEQTVNISVNNDSNQDIVGLSVEEVPDTLTLDQNMSMESNVFVLQNEGINSEMNNGILETPGCGKQPDDDSILVPKITSVEEESQSNSEDYCVVTEVHLESSDNTNKCVFHALGIPGCCQAPDSLSLNDESSCLNEHEISLEEEEPLNGTSSCDMVCEPGSSHDLQEGSGNICPLLKTSCISEEKSKLGGTSANKYRKKVVRRGKQYCRSTRKRRRSSTTKKKRLSSTTKKKGLSSTSKRRKVNFREEYLVADLDPEEPGPSHRLRVGEIPFGNSVVRRPSIVERVRRVRNLKRSRRTNWNEPDFRFQNVLYTFEEYDFTTSLWQPHRWNPEAQPLRSILKEDDDDDDDDGVKELRYKPRVTLEEDSIAQYLAFHRSRKEPIGNVSRVDDNLPFDDRYPVRVTRGMARLREQIRSDNEELTEWIRANWNELSDRARKAILERRKALGMADDFPGFNEDDGLHDEEPEDNLVIVNEKVDDEGEIEIIGYKFNNIEFCEDPSSVRFVSVKEEELASTSAMEETVEQCTVESVPGPSTCHPINTVKEEPTGQICVDIPIPMAYQNDSSRPVLKSETLGEGEGDEQAISVRCLLNDQSLQSVKQETMMNRDPLELDHFDYASMFPMFDGAMQMGEEETPLETVETRLETFSTPVRCHMKNVSIQTLVDMKNASVQTLVEWKTLTKMFFSPLHSLKDISVQTLPEEEAQIETTGSKCLMTDASVQTSAEEESQAPNISAVLKSLLTDVSVQVSAVWSDMATQASTDGSDMATQASTDGKDMSVQTSPDGKSISVQTSVDGNDISIQTSVDGNDISVQTSVDGKDISVQTSMDGNDMSVQTSMDGNDMSVQTSVDVKDMCVQTFDSTDAEVQISAEVNDMAVQTSADVNDASVQISSTDASVQTLSLVSEMRHIKSALKCYFLRLSRMSNKACIQEEEARMEGIDCKESLPSTSQTFHKEVSFEKNAELESLSNSNHEQTQMEGLRCQESVPSSSQNLAKEVSCNNVAELASLSNSNHEQTQMEGLRCQESVPSQNLAKEVSCNNVAELASLSNSNHVQTQMEGIGCQEGLPSTSKTSDKEVSVQENVKPASLSSSNHEQLPVIDVQHSNESSGGGASRGGDCEEGPLYPPLMDCQDVVADLVLKLTEPNRVAVLVRKMVQMRIATVGDFCSCKPSVISLLPLTEPKIMTALSAVMSYDHRKSLEANVSEDQADLPDSQNSSEQVQCKNEAVEISFEQLVCKTEEIDVVDCQNSFKESVSGNEAMDVLDCQLNNQAEEPETPGRIPVITCVESLKTLSPPYAALISYREAYDFWNENQNQIEIGEPAETQNIEEENTPVLASHSQFSQGSVEDINSDMISSEEPLFPALQDCSDHIDNIIYNLTDTIWSEPLKEKLQENDIFTVGALCSKSAAFIRQLPVKEPKLSNTLDVLKNYHTSRLQRETKIFNRFDQYGAPRDAPSVAPRDAPRDAPCEEDVDVISSSPGSSSDVSTVQLDELLSNTSASQLVQAILESPQRMECVSELLHQVGSIDKVMQCLVEAKVTEVLNQYWNRVRVPLQESFSHDVVEFVTRRVLHATRLECSNSLSSLRRPVKPGPTLRSRKSLNAMVKKHGWTAVCGLIPDDELKKFLSSCNFNTLKELFPPSILSEYIQGEIRRDKVFCNEIIQMALNAHIPENVSNTASLWNTVTSDKGGNEEHYKLVKDFILRPDTLSFISQMTELLALLKPVREKGRKGHSQSILPDDVLSNLLKIVSKQMPPKNFLSACTKNMMDIL